MASAVAATRTRRVTSACNPGPGASTNPDKAPARGRNRDETRSEDFRSGRAGPWGWRSERYIGPSYDLIRSVAQWFPSRGRPVARSQDIRFHSQRIAAALADRVAESRSRRKEVGRCPRAQPIDSKGRPPAIRCARSGRSLRAWRNRPGWASAADVSRCDRWFNRASAGCARCSNSVDRIGDGTDERVFRLARVEPRVLHDDRLVAPDQARAIRVSKVANDLIGLQNLAIVKACRPQCSDIGFPDGSRRLR